MEYHSQQVHIRAFNGLRCEEVVLLRLYPLGYIGRQLGKFASSGIDRSLQVLDDAANGRKSFGEGNRSGAGVAADLGNVSHREKPENKGLDPLDTTDTNHHRFPQKPPNQSLAGDGRCGCRNA